MGETILSGLEAMDNSYNLDSVTNDRHEIPIIAVTDNKPLYDHIRSDHSICQDKRLAIEILFLRRNIQHSGVQLRWVETYLVDCMTKTKAKPTLMRPVIKEGKYTIMEEKSVLEIKRAHKHSKPKQQEKD